MFTVDLNKFKKYDKPGPRYTSYPTAPQFNEQFTQADFVDEIVKTNYGKNLPDLSLYFHIPYCELSVSFADATCLLHGTEKE